MGVASFPVLCVRSSTPYSEILATPLLLLTGLLRSFACSLANCCCFIHWLSNTDSTRIFVLGNLPTQYYCNSFMTFTWNYLARLLLCVCYFILPTQYHSYKLLLKPCIGMDHLTCNCVGLLKTTGISCCMGLSATQDMLAQLCTAQARGSTS